MVEGLKAEVFIIPVPKADLNRTISDLMMVAQDLAARAGWEEQDFVDEALAVWGKEDDDGTEGAGEAVRAEGH